MADPYARADYPDYPLKQPTHYDKPNSLTPGSYPVSASPLPVAMPPYNPYARTEDVHPYQDSTTYLPTTSQYAPRESTSHRPETFVYPEVGANATTPPPPKVRSLASRIFDGEQRFAYFCWLISIIQIGVFIGELVRNAMAMKSPIEIQPIFNPLIGPSSYVSL
jgi:hypothetical protein